MPDISIVDQDVNWIAKQVDLVGEKEAERRLLICEELRRSLRASRHAYADCSLGTIWSMTGEGGAEEFNAWRQKWLESMTTEQLRGELERRDA